MEKPDLTKVKVSTMKGEVFVAKLVEVAHENGEDKGFNVVTVDEGPG